MNPLSFPLAAPTAISGSLAAAHGSEPANAERAKLSGAAKQFEAIFVRQMLAAARKTSFGDDNFGGKSVETFRQMQDERFAEIAAESGTFGIAKFVEAQLSQRLSPLPQAGGEPSQPGLSGGSV